MNYSFDEAMKEMDFLVEKMQLALPTESYRIQCAWEAIKSEGVHVSDDALDEAWNEGYDMGKLEGYDNGYDDGYSAGVDDAKEKE